jgi:hypothetical protein
MYMKQLLIIALLAITSLGANAQPNQFRDYVDHQQRFQMERPKIEKKDGKVIITMSEEQFRRMEQMRMNRRPGFQHVAMRQQNCCNKCKHHNKRQPHRRK